MSGEINVPGCPAPITSLYAGVTRTEIKEIIHRNTSSSLDGNLSTLNIDSKPSPDTLAETLNTAEEATGAIIFIKQGGKILSISNNFYLTGLSFSFKERAQLLENFNSANVAFFGESAKVYQIQGVAVDFGSTDDNDPGKYFHQSGLIDMYENALRGSKLVENDSIAVLKVLNHTIEGFPISMQVSYNSSSDKMAQFNITWVVTNHTLVLDGYLNNTRLKSFYDVSTMDKTNTKGISELVTLIDEFFDLSARRRFPDNITEEAKFFGEFGSSNTEYILGNPKFANMYLDARGTVKQAAEDFVNILKKYANEIGLKIDIMNRDTSQPFHVPMTLPSNLIHTPAQDQTFQGILYTWFGWGEADWLESVGTYMNFIAAIRRTGIVFKVNRLYTPGIASARVVEAIVC